MASFASSDEVDSNRSRTLDLIEAEKEDTCTPKSIFDLLKEYKNRVKNSLKGNVIMPISEKTDTASTCPELSTDSFIKLAKEDLVHDISHNSGSDLSCDCLANLKITSYLLSAVEKLSNQEYDSADELLARCLTFTAISENPIKRAVTKYAEALRERVDVQRGIGISLGKKKTVLIEENLVLYEAAAIVCEQRLPATQIGHFTTVQILLDSEIRTSKKIHLIDFGIKTGVHWSILMQSLSDRTVYPVELLKITAVGTSKDRLEQTGKRLSSFAESVNLPFSFKTVVTETMDLKREHLELEDDETLAVYLGLRLWSLLPKPHQLRSFMGFIRELNPCVVALTELDLSTDTPDFVERFEGSITFSMASFDCFKNCLKGYDNHRKIVEDEIYGSFIWHGVTSEYEEFFIRNARVEFWRKLFRECGMIGVELSDSSLYQASLMIKGNPSWAPCSFEIDEKCMVLHWKGTRVQSISAWKVDDDWN